MRLELERYLWERVRYLWERVRMRDEAFDLSKSPRIVIAGMLDAGLIASPKQAWRTLEKWSAAGVYGYGTTLDLGWRLRPEFPRAGELRKNTCGTPG